jgi:protein-disulfide isomerase
MASRAKHKEQVRTRRVAEQRARRDRARRQRRLQMLAGVLLGAVAVAAVAIAVSSGSPSGHTNVPTGPHARPCRASDTAICSLLAGIPETGNTLGLPTAKVSVVEYGDLECPICRDFALSSENQLIQNDVRSGRVKLTYKSLETATSGAPNPAIFGPQQAAAYAAGLQGKAWYYIELFYHHQGPEDSGYVNQTFLNQLAKLVPGLSYTKWLPDSKIPPLLHQVSSENRTAISYLTQIGATSQGQVSTPTILITGPKGRAQPIVGDPGSYAQLASAITSVQ